MKIFAVCAQVIVIFAVASIFVFVKVSGTTALALSVFGMAFVGIIAVISARAQEKRLHACITKLSRELSVAAGRISSVSQEIGITITESDVSTRALFGKAGEMNTIISAMDKNLSDMISDIRTMIGFSQDTRSMTLEMERSGNLSFEAVQSGMSEILGIVDTMKDIKGTSSVAAGSIGKLKSASGDVQTIVDTISDIAKQMHIITINATVEASRAGQYGRSFAVVAKEFQSLSDMTDRSLKDIGALIDTIQEYIDNVYGAVRENETRVEEGVGYTKAVEASLNRISDSFTGMLSMVGRISGISEEQSRSAGIMESRINEIERLVRHTTDNVTGVCQAAGEQKRGIGNIAQMGAQLERASKELNDISGSSTDLETEALDEKTRRVCSEFFPLLERELCRSAAIADGSPEQHAALLRRFKEKNPIVEAAWTNAPNGRFICSIPAAGIANAAMRDWFRAAVKGEQYISSVYISGITKNRCVTISMPFFNDSGDIGGVLGIDLNLHMLGSRK